MLSVEIMNYYLLRGDAFYFDPGGAIVFYVHKPCKHLTPEGCGIYETRPDTCVKYMCEPKDKSVKEIKKQQCDLAMAKVAEANTNYFKLKASREMPVQALST
jgi:Fe-S-cluster containining protein